MFRINLDILSGIHCVSRLGLLNKTWQTGRFKHQQCISHGSGSWKPQTRVLSLVRAPFLACRWSGVCSQSVFPLRLRGERDVSSVLDVRTLILLNQGSTRRTSFHRRFLWIPPANAATLGLGLHRRNSQGMQTFNS